MSLANSLPLLLLVSKNLPTLRFFRKLCAERFYVLEASEVHAALDYAKNLTIDVVILEEKNSEIPILSLSRQIWRSKGNENVPLLLITNNLKEIYVSQAHKAGVSDFINDPLEEKEVEQRLAAALKSKHVQKKISLLGTRIKRAPFVASEKPPLMQRFLLNDRALKEVAKAKKSKSPTSMLMIELDGFPEVLKKKGDLVAEEILLALHSFLQERVRPQDSLFPQGGARFILLLPKTSQRASQAIAEMIRSDVSTTPFATKKGNLSLTLSIGLVSFNESSAPSADPYTAFDHLLEGVNKALEKAKKKGNSVVTT